MIFIFIVLFYANKPTILRVETKEICLIRGKGYAAEDLLSGVKHIV